MTYLCDNRCTLKKTDWDKDSPCPLLFSIKSVIVLMKSSMFYRLSFSSEDTANKICWGEPKMERIINALTHISINSFKSLKNVCMTGRRETPETTWDHWENLSIPEKPAEPECGIWQDACGQISQSFSFQDRNICSQTVSQ